MPDTSLYLAIVSSEPRLGWSFNVPVQPEINVRFNQFVNEALVSTDAALNQYVILVDMATDQAYPVTFREWDRPNRILTFAPSGNLTPGAMYQVTVRKELKTAQGRQMLCDLTWSFQVSDAALGQVSLRSPGDATAFVSPPPLVWDGVWIPSGSVTYQVEVDSNWQFGNNVLWGTTLTVATSGGIQEVSIGTPLTAPAAYYWRVRACTPAISGQWSETRSFWVGNATQSSPDTQVMYDPGQAFSLVGILPENGTPNYSDWPLIRATFTQDLSGASVTSGSISLWAQAVDGRLATGIEQIPALLTVVGPTVQLSPSGTIRQNTRYTLKLTEELMGSGSEVLPAPVESYFTGPYYPLYGGTIAVRAELGPLAERISDDEILFYLWRGSLHVHEMLATRVHRVRQLISFDDLVAYLPTIVSWGMIRYAELAAAVDLLENYYYEQLPHGGAKVGLATFEYSMETAYLRELRDEIKNRREERDKWAATFLAEVVVPRVGIKSQRFWPGATPYMRPDQWDWSTRDRKKF